MVHILQRFVTLLVCNFQVKVMIFKLELPRVLVLNGAHSDKIQLTKLMINEKYCQIKIFGIIEFIENNIETIFPSK